MPDQPKKLRRIKRRVKPSEQPIEVRVAKLEAQMEEVSEYVTQELGEEGEFQVQLMTFLCHVTATIADMRDAAMVADANIHAGNVRDGIRAFTDVLTEVCDIYDKKEILKRMFPELGYQIDDLLRNQDGTNR